MALCRLHETTNVIFLFSSSLDICWILHATDDNLAIEINIIDFITERNYDKLIAYDGTFFCCFVCFLIAFSLDLTMKTLIT